MRRILIMSTFFITVLICSCSSSIRTSVQASYPYKELKIKGIVDSVRIVEAGNLIGSEKDELIVGRDSVIYIYDIVEGSAELLYSKAFPENILQLSIGDADNDGRDELILATGYDGYKDANVKIYVIKYVDGNWKDREIYSKASPRPQVTYLDIADINHDWGNEIVTSYFNSKYIIETVTLSKNNRQWKSNIHETKRMSTTRDIGILPGSAQTQEVVGRVYGDSSGANGDAYILTKSGQHMLPTYRGVRSAITIGDGDNDGENEIYLGDGWHQDYGKMARARLGEIESDGADYSYSLIEDVKGNYEISQIAIEDITGDGDNELVTRGNKTFRIYKFDKERNAWKVFVDTTIGSNVTILDDTKYVISNQFTIGDINGDGHKDVIFNGMPYSKSRDNGVKVYNFANFNYSFDLDEEVKLIDIDPESLMGQPAPELRISEWLNGSFPGIAKSRGKVIMLDFWATWCGPCIKMFPTLKGWQKKYGDDGLQIIGLTRLDGSQTMEKIKTFVEKENFAYPIGVTEESFTHIAFGANALPHMVLIDKKGVIRKYEVGQRDGVELEKLIVKLLNE